MGWGCVGCAEMEMGLFCGEDDVFWEGGMKEWVGGKKIKTRCREFSKDEKVEGSCWIRWHCLSRRQDPLLPSRPYASRHTLRLAPPPLLPPLFSPVPVPLGALDQSPILAIQPPLSFPCAPSSRVFLARRFIAFRFLSCLIHRLLPLPHGDSAVAGLSVCSSKAGWRRRWLEGGVGAIGSELGEGCCV